MFSGSTQRANATPTLTRQPIGAVAMADGMLHAQQVESKSCSRCGETKPLSAFPKSIRHRSMCKACRSRASIQYQRDNRAEVRTRHKRWRDANPEVWKAHNRAALARIDPDKRRAQREKAKDRYIERKYGITRAQWDAMREAQNGVCAICRVPGRTGRHSKLVVDHCHETGRIRGLLCGPCNVALGIFGDTTEALERVLRYVRGDGV